MSETVVSKTVVSTIDASYEGIAYVTYDDGSQEIHYDVKNHGDAADKSRESYAQRLAARSGGIPARQSSPAA